MTTLNSPWDRMHKAVLGEHLAEHGRVETSLEIVGETLFGDVAFWPGASLDVRASRVLGLLGRMAAHGPCLFEPHSDNPRQRDLGSAVQKAQRLDRQMRAEDDEDGTSVFSRVWLISPGRPEQLLASFGCRRQRAWPEGVYLSAPGLKLAVVVVSELPVQRSTLVLRLLGRGKILKQAWEELTALPDDAPERRLVGVLANEARHIEEARRLGLIEESSEEVEVFMSAQQWLEQRYAEQKSEGRREGARTELLALVALRLERALTEREEATVTALLEQGEKLALTRAVLDLDAAGLATWLAERAG